MCGLSEAFRSDTWEVWMEAGIAAKLQPPTPRRVHNFRWESAAAVGWAARQVYELYGTPGNLRIEHPDAAHESPSEMRQIADQLFERVLR